MDALDSSMVPYISEILFLFEIPEKFDELNKKINDIEQRQSERIATLDSMASPYLNMALKFMDLVI